LEKENVNNLLEMLYEFPVTFVRPTAERQQV